MDVPSGYIQFLQTLMPSKPRSELYTAVGLAKQGKTLFYRDLLHHLHHSQDVFVEAPGTPGLVMHVFNLPSYPYVLKVIKDEFGHSKQTDRATVKRKFLMVKQIDRVGRMADTLEFKNLALPARPLLARAARPAARARAVDDRAGRRQRDRRALLRRAAHDPAQPLPRLGDAGGGRGRGAGVRRHDPRPRDRERLRRRHALAQLRRQPPRPRRLLRLRRDRVPHRLHLPRHPAAAESRGRALGRAVVSRSARSTSSRRSSRPSCSATRRCARRSCATTPTCSQPEFWQRCQEQVGRGEIVDFFPYPENVRFSRRFASS